MQKPVIYFSAGVYPLRRLDERELLLLDEERLTERRETDLDLLDEERLMERRLLDLLLVRARDARRLLFE